MTQHRVRLVEATPEMLEAISRGPEALAAVLGIDPPAGWPEFPDAYEFVRERLTTHPDEAGWWTCLFTDRESGRVLGSGGYKGPPRDGIVEIGYEVAPQYRARGIATDAAGLLIERAFAVREISAVDAHTLAGTNASTTVLARWGFRRIGELDDPGHGPITHWRLAREECVAR
ncbi:MAG: GNAT family N-acetyltransferase [Actinomycetota bacterium]|nr:GNAT family N-acetyltransferase [Actinomycetota bacterium]